MLFFPKPKLCICYWDAMPRHRFDAPARAATNVGIDTDFNEKDASLGTEPHQPSVLLFSDPTLDISTALKTTREFAHEKKFAKKGVANSRRQAHKGHRPDRGVTFPETCHYCRVSSAAAARIHVGRTNPMLYNKGFHLKLGDGRYSVDNSDESEMDESEDETGWAGAASVESRPMAAEIPLVELMRPARRRKLRQKGPMDDFEFVPPVRSVVVLDESAAPEPDVDDPWECVDWEEDDPDEHRSFIQQQMPTFAEVLTRDV